MVLQWIVEDEEIRIVGVGVNEVGDMLQVFIDPLVLSTQSPDMHSRCGDQESGRGRKAVGDWKRM